MTTENPSVSVNDTSPTPQANPLTRWFIIIGAVLVIGGAWVGLNRVNLSDQSQAPALPVAGSPAPDFTLQTLAGETMTLSDFRGTPVLVNFWATWCGPCRIEMPEFQDAYRERGDDFVILAVNATVTDNGDIPGFVAEMGLTFPILLDETGDVMDTYQIFAMPTSVFINREGIIEEVFTGPVNKAYIESKLAGM
jgi:peroxiredoxin